MLFAIGRKSAFSSPNDEKTRNELKTAKRRDFIVLAPNWHSTKGVPAYFGGPPRSKIGTARPWLPNIHGKTGCANRKFASLRGNSLSRQGQAPLRWIVELGFTSFPALRQPRPIDLPRVLISRDRIFVLFRINQLFLLRPALIDALQAPFDAALHADGLLVRFCRDKPASTNRARRTSPATSAASRRQRTRGTRGLCG